MPKSIPTIECKAIFPNSFDLLEECAMSLPQSWASEPWRLIEEGALQTVAAKLEAEKLGRIRRQGDGYVFIGHKAEVHKKAQIRGWVIACEGVKIGARAEIKNAFLLPQTKAPHWCIVSDSIVGYGTNIGAGVVLANVREDGKIIHLGWNGWLTSTGLKKFGSLVGDSCFIGCNAVLAPGTILGAECKVRAGTYLANTWPPNSRIGKPPITFEPPSTPVRGNARLSRLSDP